MLMSGKDFLKSHVLSWWWKVYSDWEDGTSSGRAFQVFRPATGKARLPTVDRLTGGTRRQLVPVEWSDCLPGRLHTGTSGPRYGGALPWRTLSAGWSLYSIRSEHATSEEWPMRQWCDRQIAGGRSSVRQHSVPTIVAVQGMLVGQHIQHFHSPVLSAAILPAVTGMGRWHQTTDLSEFWKGCKVLWHHSLNTCMHDHISVNVNVRVAYGSNSGTQCETSAVTFIPTATVIYCFLSVVIDWSE